METSTSAGILHVFEQNDHGLMLFSKNDDFQQELTKALESNEITFCYFITIKGGYMYEKLSCFPTGTERGSVEDKLYLG